MTKLIQNRVLTAIVGSYPKPKYIYKGSGRELLDSSGMSFFIQRRQMGNVAFNKRLDKAVETAIKDQNLANIDFITDGEQRRDHYVYYVLRGLAGINFEKIQKKKIRGGVFTRNVPTVTGKIKHTKPILTDDLRFTKKFAKNTAKIGLPGPMTAIDCVADEHYKGQAEKMAQDYAKAIHAEIGLLIDAGCKVIQFDDPVLLRYPDMTKKWGLRELQNCFKEFENKALFIVHICCVYPNKPFERKGIEYKANKDYYKDILQWLSNSTLDVISIEGAQSNLDLSALPSIGKKSLMLGVLDVGSNTIESIESLVARGKEALRYIPREQLILAPDCGMLQLERHAAKMKHSNMSQAARILNS